MQTLSACFNRFSLELPTQAARDCSHQGACDEDVRFWSRKIARPEGLTPELLVAELKEYGAWDVEELADDSANWQRIIWIAAGNIAQEIAQRYNS